MHLFRKGPLRFCGRLIGGAAVYALLLNLILAGLVSAQAADTAGAFELCLTGDNAAPFSGDQNSGHDAGKIHCILCTTGGITASVPVQSATVAVVFSSTRIFARPVFDDDALVSVGYLSPSPRGPPQQA